MTVILCLHRPNYCTSSLQISIINSSYSNSREANIAAKHLKKVEKYKSAYNNVFSALGITQVAITHRDNRVEALKLRIRVSTIK